MIIGEVVPHLFVGLGGVGGKVVQRIATMLKGKWDFDERYSRLAKFAVVDTDSSAISALKRGDRGTSAVDETVLISDFDKQAFASIVRGAEHAVSDPYYTQWIHDDYTFRAGDSAGAGQVRLESRLGLAHSLVKGDLHERFSRLLDQLRHHLNAAANADAAIHVHVAFSIAGGTGSGTFLPFAYFIKALAKRERIPLKVFGYAIQPHIMEDLVGANFEDICANSYAALKELEHFNHLAVQGAIDDGIELHYDLPARVGREPRVSERPFELVYVIDAPSGCHVPHPEDALADCIYLQLFSPFGAAQASDVDNFAKHQRGLFPASLYEETGQGYTAFYGSLGMSVLQVPDDDVLRYCALRFASDAIKTYLLLDDPLLVPAKMREAFNRFVLTEEERKQLSEEARKRSLDEAFARKLEVIADEFAEKPQTFWGRLHVVAGRVQEEFEARFDEVVANAARKVESRIAELNPLAITDHLWMPDAALGQLGGQVVGAVESLEAACQQVEKQIAHDWWPEFLAKAGPGRAPLNPYEQRYCLLVLRGLCPRVAPESTAALGSAKREAAEAARRAADKLLQSAVDDEFKGDLNGSVATLRETAPRSFFDQFRKQALEEQQAEAREGIVRRFNERTARIRAGLRARVRGRFLAALHAASEGLLERFREIDQQGATEAVALVRIASDYIRDGRLRYRLADGRVIEPFSEAEQYTLDEEALMHPNRGRLWDRYYDDQIRPLLGDDAQLEAVQKAFTEALKPRHDESGRVIQRSGYRLILEIADALFEQAQQVLEARIKGVGGQGGLLVDDAIALESVYVRAADTPYPVEAARLVDAARNGRPSIDVDFLWSDPTLRQATEAYAREKIGRAQRVKAGLLCTVDRDKVTADVKFSERLVVGAHDRYTDTQRPFGRILQASVGDAFVPFTDAKRVFFYRYLYGVPIYAFPKVVTELQHHYRHHQTKARKAWYLHIDKNFEQLPDLDPCDVKEDLAVRLVPLFESGRLFLALEGGDVKIRDGEVVRSLAPTLEAAADQVALWKAQDELSRPALFDKLLASELESALKLLSRPTQGAAEKLLAYYRRLQEEEARAMDDRDVDQRYVKALKQLRATAHKAALKVRSTPIA